MATSDELRVSVDKLVRTITLYGSNIAIVSEDALESAGLAGARAIANVIKTSTTPTGAKRALAGGEAGRIDSGDLYNSIYDDTFDENSGGAHTLTNRAGNLQLKIGFINSPDYATYQENGTRSIHGMHAVAVGFAAARGVLFEALHDALKQAGQDAKAGRVSARGKRFAARGL